MSKLYFDDPLYAAIAARDFGVKLQWAYDAGATHRDTNMLMVMSEESMRPYQRNTYIHPDSYHIFEPKPEDEARAFHPRRGHRRVLFDGANWLLCNIIPNQIIDPDFSIFPDKRNGKLFPWPKREEKVGA
jgi:hypothetical protein